MALDASILQILTMGTTSDAWRYIIDRTLEIASRPLSEGNAPNEVIKRDREIGELDLSLPQVVGIYGKASVRKISAVLSVHQNG